MKYVFTKSKTLFVYEGILPDSLHDKIMQAISDAYHLGRLDGQKEGELRCHPNVLSHKSDEYVNLLKNQLKAAPSKQRKALRRLKKLLLRKRLSGIQ